MGGVSEREGQKAFYDRFLQALDPTKTMDDVLGENTDGVVNGNILEFKTSVSNLNAALFQCLKYLSAMRLKGKPVPANILIIDLVKEQVYLYESALYLSEIQTVYVGAASKDNKNFAARITPKILDYKCGELGEIELIETLKSNNFTKIDIDENCIVGWAEAFYSTCPEARKEDFIGHNEKNAHKTIGEIRKPVIFKDFINPYEGDTNIKFEYLMDRLNDRIQKKDLGAFYTPPFYAKKAQELLMKAISRVPAGNDYVIIDRCAGTGNLEEGLDPEILSHCILSTYEYYEYKVLIEKFAGKAMMIIPPSDEEADGLHVDEAGVFAWTHAAIVGSRFFTDITHDDEATSAVMERDYQIAEAARLAARKISLWLRAAIAVEPGFCLPAEETGALLLGARVNASHPTEGVPACVLNDKFIPMKEEFVKRLRAKAIELFEPVDAEIARAIEHHRASDRKRHKAGMSM